MPIAERPVAVVTGGAHRLGAAISRALAAAGYGVVVNYRTSQQSADSLVAELRSQGARASAVAADVGVAAEVDRLLAQTLAEYDRVDVLVANAGVFRRTPIESLSEDDWSDMLDGNLRPTFLCSQRFGIHMRNRGGGAIVAMADVAGLRPWTGYLPYNVAKAGTVALVQTLAKELAPNVRVNAIAPGPVLFPTDYNPVLRQREIDRTLLRREGRAENIADAVLALVRNDYITGVVLPVDGGRLLA
ncbi:MAG TPA: SDR family oxidoreductase [Candidatus Acidoferrales bacterium]|nr:SDR family oxidoreductase [Candidatus Acidoferrales bacterium]